MNSVSIKSGIITVHGSVVIETCEEIDLIGLSKAMVHHVDDALIERTYSEDRATITVDYACHHKKADAVRDALKAYLDREIDN